MLISLCLGSIAAQMRDDASSLALRHARQSYEHAQIGDLVAAEEQMRAAIAAMPGNPMLHSGLGGILKQSGRTAAARDAFARAVELDPANPIFRLQLAERLWELGERRDAGAHLDEIPNTSPQHAAAQLLSGLIAAADGDCARAVTDFGEAFSLVKGRTDAMQALAGCHLQLGRLDEARAVLDELVSAGDVTAGIHQLVARLHARSGEADLATQAFEAGLVKDAQNEGLHLEFGAFLAREARYRAGTAFAEQAAGRFPDCARCFEMLGYFQWKRHENIASVDSYKRALQLDPDSPGALAGLGIAQTEAGMLDDAQVTLTSSLERFPTHAALRQSLGVLLQLRAETGGGALSDAMEMFESAVRLDPGLKESHYRLGVIALDSGHVSKALSHLEKAASGTGTDRRVHYALFRAYRRAGRAAEAAEALRRFQSIKQAEDAEQREPVVGAGGRQ